MKNAIKATLTAVAAGLALFLPGGLNVKADYNSYSYSRAETATAAATKAYTSAAKKTTTTTTKTYTSAATATTPKTAASGTASKGRLAYHGYTSGMENDNPKDLRISFKEDNPGDLFTPDSYTDAKWYFFHFSDYAEVGVGNFTDGIGASEYYINADNVFYSIGKFGFRAQIKDGRYLKVSSYGNKELICKELKITSNNDKTLSLKYSTDTKSGKLTADLYDACYTNGFYAITGTYTYEGKTQQCSLYLFVNCKSDSTADYHFYLCCGKQYSEYVDFHPGKRAKELRALLESEGITPENSLNTNIYYPCFAPDTSYLDTQYWIDKSYELLDGCEKNSDSYKVFLLHEWMTENIIYDDYKVDVLKYPRYYNHWDEHLYVSDIHIGVCLDFSNIFLIMCREHGIPCVMLTTPTHAWNAVWLNGEWVEIDLTVDINRHAKTADITDITGTKLHCYSGFCSYNVNTCTPTSAKEHLYTY